MVETCPCCGAQATPVEENHYECGACGYYFNPAVFHRFVVKPAKDMDEGDVLAEYSMV